MFLLSLLAERGTRNQSTIGMAKNTAGFWRYAGAAFKNFSIDAEEYLYNSWY